jgi:hypothetical protein
MKSRIEEAMETVNALQSLARIDTLPQSERMAVLAEFSKRRSRIRSDMQYLAENLHSSDPRKKAAQTLLEIVEKIER